MTEKKPTPWRRAFAKLGLTQNQLAGKMLRHRAKICRALADERGLINGADQELLLKVARDLGVDLKPEDLVPTL